MKRFHGDSLPWRRGEWEYAEKNPKFEIRNKFKKEKLQ
jgi:hypothetical protein